VNPGTHHALAARTLPTGGVLHLRPFTCRCPCAPLGLGAPVAASNRAAPDACDVRSAAGFGDAELEILPGPGPGHTDCDVAALVAQVLRDAGRLR